MDDNRKDTSVGRQGTKHPNVIENKVFKADNQKRAKRTQPQQNEKN